MNDESIKKLAALCMGQLEKEGKGITEVLRNPILIPFPIGKTYLENLIHKNQLPITKQIKLAEYFGLKIKITLEE